MKKQYLVCYSTGGFGDYAIHHVFVTQDLSKAQKWTDKYNRILNTYKPFYDTLYDDFIESDIEHPLLMRSVKFCEYNEASFEEIEVR